jgi:hypothetical protein
MTIATAAVDVTLPPRAIDEAIRLGQSALSRERTAFHTPYRLTVARPPVDFIEVITPFRRLVLIAEQRARAGDRAFGQRHVREIPGALAEELELRVELTFHPLNTFVAVPDYTLALAGPSGRVEPRTFDRVPRYTPRVDGPPMVTPVPGAPSLPRASQPILGGTLTARFDLRALDPKRVYDIVVSEGGTEVGAKLDLSRLR